MRITKHPLMTLAVCAGLLSTTFAGLAQAQGDYPSKPITIVVGYSPGGQTDLIARKVAGKLGEELGQTVVVQNRDGASSTIAYRAVAESRPDGYTVMFAGTSAHAIAPLLMKVTYDATEDFKAVAMLTTLPLSVSVGRNVPADNLGELVELVREDPDRYSFATGGPGGIEHLTGELLKQSAGDLQLLHIPFKGGAPAATAVMAGEVPILINPLSSVYSFGQDGRLKILAVTAQERMDTDPDIPTAVESGFPDLVAEGFNALLVPAETPDEVVQKLNAAVNRVMADAAFVDELKAMRVKPITSSTPASTDEYLRNEVKRWADVVQKADISVQ